MLNLDAIRRRCEAATGEPWKTTLDAVPWEIDAELFAEQGAYIYTEKEEGQPWPNSGVTVVAVVRAAEVRQRALGVDDSELMHAELDLARSLDAYEAADAHNEKGD